MPAFIVVRPSHSLVGLKSPRDAVTISRTFNDATTIIDVSTSLLRSPDEPAYLRPSPPYVRSHVKLFVWCIQSLPPTSSQQSDSRHPLPTHLREKRIQGACV
ncbi:hypothetical protein BJV78DRAFT_1374838 [Lactifluus subvellereus]|nr:hypothetical protein BJV78DRAFT_1374838 [Lactifluus subvellereus]